MAVDLPYATAEGLDPVHMTDDERLEEVARILALGIVRLRARQESKKSNDPNHLREFGLDFSHHTSVCVAENKNNGEGQ